MWGWTVWFNIEFGGSAQLLTSSTKSTAGLSRCSRHPSISNQVKRLTFVLRRDVGRADFPLLPRTPLCMPFVPIPVLI